MRIISGSLKGKKIKYLKNLVTRPLKDTVKENIFNILQHSNKIKIDLNKSVVLDLYSGVGSFGFECISRGSKKVTFIEGSIEAFKLLKTNSADLSVVSKTNLINNNVENINNLIGDEKFNLIFFDPPFTDTKYINILAKIKQKKIYFNNHIIILHRERKSKDEIENYLETLFIKEYGRSKIIFGKFI